MSALPATAAPARPAVPLPPVDGSEAVPVVPGYCLLRPIGSGRRSQTWYAWDQVRRCEVALKLQPAAQGDFAREFALAERLRNPHGVAVLAHGRSGGTSWLAMELVEGGELALRLRAPIGMDAALGWLAQAAQALAVLHRAGYVHRDVKPQNFLVRADGRLALADLGLAVPAGQAPAAGGGALFGTPRYVAPEQLQGAAAAPAADVYSLGVLLFEMLCGRPPFAGETLMEVLAQHLVAPPPRLEEGLAACQPMMDRMLAKEVQCRLPDAEAVLGLLGRRCDRDPE